MRLSKSALWLAVLLVLASAVFSRSSARASANPSTDEQTIWDLEHSYWQYVQANDLNAYRNLWHKDFVGWRFMSDAPVHKDHITDWISSRTGKGESFQLLDFKAADIQRTGDVIVVYYRVTAKWTAKDGKGTPYTTRITDTWLKAGASWQILGGMSSPEPSSETR